MSKGNGFYIGKNVFASLIVTYRYGREEDEVMGVSFKKELVVDRVQVYPGNQQEEKAKFQVRGVDSFLNPGGLQ